MRMMLAALLVCLPLGAAQDRDPLDAYFDGLDSVTKRIDRYPGGVEGLARLLGGDPAKVREVLATLDFEPYAGVMKGAEGALVAGSGNSFDQALLAAALLGPAAKVRFAIGELSLDKVRERFVARAPRPPAPAADDLKAQVDWKAVAEAKASVWKLVDDEVAELGRLLAGKGVRLEATPANLDTAWCWVEFERDGAWHPLVEPPCEAKQRVDRLPDRLFHKVEVFARLERFDGSKLVNDEILRVAYWSADLFGKPLTFRIVPAPGQPGMGKSLAGKGKLKVNPLEALRAVKIFVPSVQLGRTGQYGRPFDLEGRVYSINASKGFAVEGFEAAGNRVGNLLARKAPPGPPTGVWWGVRRTGPGLTEQAWEREVADLIGYGRPRAPIERLDAAQTDRLLLGFFGEHQLHVDAGGLSLAEGLLRVRRAMEPLRGFFKGVRAYKAGKKTFEEALRDFQPEEQTFTAFQVMRTTFRKELETRFKARSFAPAPGLVALHWEIVDAGEGRVKLRETFDIMDLPASIEGPEAARFRFALGVLDTELELQTCDCNPPMYNTASLIRRAKPELRCLTKPAEADALPFKPAAKERVKADLRAGHAVVVPAAEIDGEACWWRVDPKTGAALGIGEGGCGQTATEYWLEVHDRIKESYTIGKTLYCYLMAIWTNPITPNALTGEAPDLDVLKEILKCIPICKGLKKLNLFPENQDPYARFGVSLETEAVQNKEGACKAGEKWLDTHVLSPK